MHDKLQIIRIEINNHIEIKYIGIILLHTNKISTFNINCFLYSNISERILNQIIDINKVIEHILLYSIKNNPTKKKYIKDII